MREIIQIETNKQNGLYDITEEVRHIVKNSKVPEGIVNIYVQGATAGIMIQENWDQSVQNDMIN